MWFERWVIIVLSLKRDFIPTSWGVYTPTFYDWATYIGSFGLFFVLFFLFVRLLPMVAIFEVRDLVHKTEHKAHDKKKVMGTLVHKGRVLAIATHHG